MSQPGTLLQPRVNKALSGWINAIDRTLCVQVVRYITHVHPAELRAQQAMFLGGQDSQTTLGGAVPHVGGVDRHVHVDVVQAVSSIMHRLCFLISY